MAKLICIGHIQDFEQTIEAVSLRVRCQEGTDHAGCDSRQPPCLVATSSKGSHKQGVDMSMTLASIVRMNVHGLHILHNRHSDVGQVIVYGKQQNNLL